MCGIFAYSGKRNAYPAVVEGLKRLEYRGYDSWGVAFRTAHTNGGKIEVVKTVGEISLASSNKKVPKTSTAVGHTRWATHGGVTKINAHPHESTDGSFVLAQNGIVENYQELKSKLKKKGYHFKSETDTEVIVRLIEDKVKKGAKSLREAVQSAFADLHGRNTIIILEEESPRIISIRNGSPLVVGIAGDKNNPEYYFASDTLSFANYTDKVVYVKDMQMVEVSGNELKMFDVRNGKAISYKVEKLDHTGVAVEKEGFDHFMLKEIVEQQHTVREAVQYTQKELSPLLKAIKSARRVYTVGAGTASFAASQIAFYLRKYAGISAVELKSYEMGSYKDLFTNRDLVIAVSQSGETADTIEALEFAKKKGAKIASIVNMVGSTITLMSDYAYLSRSGPEICVASTKAFTSQISWGLLVAKSLKGEYKGSKKQIISTGEVLEKYFSKEKFAYFKKLAKKLKKHEHFFVLGKGQNFYIALEGALKIKEITYKHFEGFAAGELKHGVIALIEKGTPVFLIASNDDDKNDVLSVAAEVKARGAWTIGVTFDENDFFDENIVVPDVGYTSPVMNVVPFQLISYFLGVELGNSPDKPRNLAKSVTVK